MWVATITQAVWHVIYAGCSMACTAQLLFKLAWLRLYKYYYYHRRRNGDASVSNRWQQQQHQQQEEVIVRQWLIAMGPLFIKLAQIASVRSDIVGKRWASAMAPMRDSVHSSQQQQQSRRRFMESALVQKLWFRHGIMIRNLAQPIAAGSIADVYWGTLSCHDGRYRRVAIKVLRSGVRQRLRFDMWWMQTLCRLPGIPAFLPAAIAELHRLLEPQLDLRVEAHNAHLLATNTHRNIRVAEMLIVESDMLVMEWIESQPLPPPPPSPQTSSRADEIVRIAKCMLDAQLIHMDLHPGNVIWSNSNDNNGSSSIATVIDCGLLYHIPDDIAEIWQMAMTAVDTGEIKTLAGLIYDYQPQQQQQEQQQQHKAPESNNTTRRQWIDHVANVYSDKTTIAALAGIIRDTVKFGIATEPRMTGLCMAMCILEGHYMQLQQQTNSSSGGGDCDFLHRLLLD